MSAAAIALTAKAFDFAIFALSYFAQRGVRVNELGAEIQAAHDEGRDADVERFRVQAHAARDAAHAVIDEE